MRAWLVCLSLLIVAARAEALVWSLEQRLLPSDADANGEFGVALAADGGTLVVGKPLDDHASLVDAGAAYVYTRKPAGWVLQQVLTASDGVAGDRFGFAVSLSGDLALIGAPGADVGGQTQEGAAYVFSRAGETWTQAVKLVGGAATNLNDELGYAVAISGNTALVGAPFAAESGQGTSGKVLVFVRVGGVWGAPATLAASPVVAQDSFGAALALDGDVAVIGINRLLNTGFVPSGAAYAFVRTAGVFAQEQQLSSPTPAVQDRFGSVVALDGARALVGAPGAVNAAHSFVRSGSVWTLEDTLPTSGGGFVEFAGGALALDGDTALVGAPFAPGAGSFAGAAYVFERSGSIWTETDLIDGATTTSARFGTALALAGDEAVAGAPDDDWSGIDAPGTAHTFARVAGAFAPLHLLVAEGGADDVGFATSLAVHQEFAVANRTQGVEIYRDVGGVWVHDALLGSGGALGNFGRDVDVWGTTLAVGFPANMASGWTRIYVRDPGGAWLQQGADLAPIANVSDSLFGGNVDLEGDRLAISAHRYPLGQGFGRMFVFDRVGAVWSETQELAGAAPAADLNFGDAISLSGNRLATTEAGAGLMFNQPGRVYTFLWNGLAWQSEANFQKPAPVTSDFFGRGIAIQDDTLFARSANGTVFRYVQLVPPSWTLALETPLPTSFGAHEARHSTALSGLVAAAATPEDSGPARPGEVRTFESDGQGIWSTGPTLLASPPANDDFFGRAIALDGNLLLVSARDTTALPQPTGVVFVLRTTGNVVSPTDVDLDLVANFQDVCPVVPDPGQADGGSVAVPGHVPSLPDGIGDACQCGDLDADARVTLADLVGRLRPALAGISRPFAPELCSVIGPIAPGDADLNGLRDDCDVADLVVLARALGGLAPGIAPRGCTGVPES